MTEFISFNTWLDRNRDDFMVPTIECPDCDGEGCVSCRCCGSEIACESCDGMGRIGSDGTLHLDKLAAIRAFEAAKTRDTARQAVWGIK